MQQGHKKLSVLPSGDVGDVKLFIRQHSLWWKAAVTLWSFDVKDQHQLATTGISVIASGESQDSIVLPAQMKNISIAQDQENASTRT